MFSIPPNWLLHMGLVLRWCNHIVNAQCPFDCCVILIGDGGDDYFGGGLDGGSPQLFLAALLSLIDGGRKGSGGSECNFI